MGRKNNKSGKKYSESKARNQFDNHKNEEKNESLEKNNNENNDNSKEINRNDSEQHENGEANNSSDEDENNKSFEDNETGKKENKCNLDNNRESVAKENENNYIHNQDSVEEKKLEGNQNQASNANQEEDSTPKEKAIESKEITDKELCKNANEEKSDQEKNNLVKEDSSEIKNEPLLNRKRGSSGVMEAEFFRAIRSENSYKLRKQILKMQNRADKYVEKLYRNSNQFQEIKIELLSKKSENIFTAFSSFVGINWRINLKRTNFFILAAEAWIIEVFRALENNVETYLKKQSENIKSENQEAKAGEINDPMLSEYPENFTFSAIIKKIAKMKIDEQNYLFNLSVLTGSVYCQSYSSSTTKLIENNIGKLFFNSVKKILSEFELKEKHEDEELDQKKFENLLIEILRKAVEKALNSMDSQASELKSSSSYINYLQCWEKLREEAKDNPKKFSYKRFLQILEKENFKLNIKTEILLDTDKPDDKLGSSLDKNKINSEAISRDFSIKICAETFFDFCSYKFPLIIEEIIIFIREHHSLNFRLKNLFGQTMNKFVDYNKKYINFFKAIYNGIRNQFQTKVVKRTSDSIDKLYEYYHKKFPKPFEVINNQKENVARSYNFCKNWVTSSIVDLKNMSSYALENYFYEKYKFLYASLINPIYNLSYSIANNMTKLIVFNISKCSACLISYKNIMMRLITIIKKIIQRSIIIFYERTIGFLGIQEKIKFLQDTNDKKLIEFEESENKDFFVVKVNSRIIGNLLFKIKSIRTDLIRLIFESYKSVFRKAFQIPNSLISFSNKKGLEVLDFLKLKFEEIAEAE